MHKSIDIIGVEALLIERLSNTFHGPTVLVRRY